MYDFTVFFNVDILGRHTSMNEQLYSLPFYRVFLVFVFFIFTGFMFMMANKKLKQMASMRTVLFPKYCPNCGTSVEKSNFCQNCGYRII